MKEIIFNPFSTQVVDWAGRSCKGRGGGVIAAGFMASLGAHPAENWSLFLKSILQI